MEWLNEAWSTWILPLISGISISTIGTAIIGGITKATTTKIISKFDVKSITEQCLNTTMDKVKTNTYSVDIEPLVNSKLTALNDTLAKTIQANNETENAKIEAIGDLIKCVGQFFLDSVGVGEDKKTAFKNAVEVYDKLNENIVVKPVEVKIEIVENAKPTATKKQGAIR